MTPDAVFVEAAKVFEFDACDDLFWRVDDGSLNCYAKCSDFFAWGCSDVEPIKTAEDIALLRQCRTNLVAATGDEYPLWISCLYAARKRNLAPASFMLSGKYAMDSDILHLFPQAVAA